MLNVTEVAVRQHLSAIPCDLFEIGVFFPDPGNSRMLLRTWDEATVLKSLRWLRAKNREGAAIYVRPHGQHPYSLADDLKADALPRMKDAGYSPAIVVETSPGNFQAWLNHGQVLDRQTSTSAARRIATRFGGDPGAADWRHFGRLAGFTNRKPAYEKPGGLYPFVTITAYAPGVYAAANDFIAEIKSMAGPKPKDSTLRKPPASEHGAPKSIEEFRSNPKYAADGNRADLAYAVYALSHGANDDTVRAAIQSRDLTKKGSETRQNAYVDRTIDKARHRAGLTR